MSFFPAYNTTEHEDAIFRKLSKLEPFLIVILLTYTTWKLFTASVGRHKSQKVEVNPSKEIANVPKFRLLIFRLLMA